MKIKELRLGNYLLADIGTVKVESVLGSAYRVYAHSLDEEYLADYSIAHLKPIPLTEEWLIKAGFKINAEYEHPAFNEYILNGVGIGDFNGEYWICEIIDQAGLSNEIKYVHQLQNLYFALTGEELELKH